MFPEWDNGSIGVSSEFGLRSPLAILPYSGAIIQSFIFPMTFSFIRPQPWQIVCAALMSKSTRAFEKYRLLLLERTVSVFAVRMEGAVRRLSSIDGLLSRGKGEGRVMSSVMACCRWMGTVSFGSPLAVSTFTDPRFKQSSSCATGCMLGLFLNLGRGRKPFILELYGHGREFIGKPLVCITARRGRSGWIFFKVANHAFCCKRFPREKTLPAKDWAIETGEWNSQVISWIATSSPSRCPKMCRITEISVNPTPVLRLSASGRYLWIVAGPTFVEAGFSGHCNFQNPNACPLPSEYQDICTILTNQRTCLRNHFIYQDEGVSKCLTRAVGKDLDHFVVSGHELRAAVLSCSEKTSKMDQRDRKFFRIKSAL
ncbi:hypothetical protein RF11_09580 [Thelohanellus kitauei]|uniref:Uncharacterized protein n=1 Tax=Thelohanellus kitauei TaxID=669202 RepID=A0A0C2IAC0_THEKT|nr:hypothetical protein RF11_09580 [Thelohanellus kitauei]